MRTRLFAAVVAVPLAVLMLACGATSGVTSSGAGAGPQDPAVASSAGPPAPTAAVTAFADGTYEVGAAAGQVPPGKYRTTVPGDSAGCYWERLKGLSGQFSDIIANGNGDPNVPVIVTIGKGDAGFKTERCGTWQRA